MYSTIATALDNSRSTSDKALLAKLRKYNSQSK